MNQRWARQWPAFTRSRVFVLSYLQVTNSVFWPLRLEIPWSQRYSWLRPSWKPCVVFGPDSDLAALWMRSNSTGINGFTPGQSTMKWVSTQQCRWQVRDPRAQNCQAQTNTLPVCFKDAISHWRLKNHVLRTIDYLFLNVIHLSDHEVIRN